MGGKMFLQVRYLHYSYLLASMVGQIQSMVLPV